MATINWLSGRKGNEILNDVQHLGRVGSEIIPDSEEERERIRQELRLSKKIIVISSDESSGDEGCTSISMSPTKPSVALPQAAKDIKSKKYTAFRRIIQSSDEESEVEIIESTTYNASTDIEYVSRDTVKGKEAVREEEPSRQADDGGIIVFDEPRGAAKPLRTRNREFSGILLPKSGKPADDEDKSRPSTRSSAIPAPVSTPVSRRLGGKNSTPRSNSEKAKLIEKQERLYDYAQDLFATLNNTVFKGGLPSTTKLNWNKRLLKTAGRAKFHRSREGVQTVEIELAQKILDCEERIRNTLSHEMCHLATWIINNKIDEHHGSLFKQWANLVMKLHPEIHVSVRHDYEISYPFEWKCEKCGKIYGRFSKSIRPDECVCGACKGGNLIPMFTTKRASNASKVSKFAAVNPQDSPITYHLQSTAPAEKDSESEDSVVEVLATTFSASITL